MAEAAQLASEKLEDLNRFPTTDQHVMVNSGDNACGLTVHELSRAALPLALPPSPAASITIGGTTYTVNYGIPSSFDGQWTIRKLTRR